jgi:hypothetical protein
MTDRNNGEGTVESRREFIIPASPERDCTAKHANDADCSDKIIAAQCANGQVVSFFPEVLLVCNGGPANARLMGYQHKG